MKIEEVKLGEHITIYRVPYTPLLSKKRIIEDAELLPFFAIGKGNDAWEHDSNKYFTSLWEIEKVGLNICLSLLVNKSNNLSKYNNKYFNHSWINIIRAKDPIQFHNKPEEEYWHHHRGGYVFGDIKNIPKTEPFLYDFTWVFYIQMPDNLEGTEGHLLLRDHTGEVFPVLPRENEFIIQSADVWHLPRPAYNSTKDRIVLTGTFGFENI